MLTHSMELRLNAVLALMLLVHVGCSLGHGRQNRRRHHKFEPLQNNTSHLSEQHQSIDENIGSQRVVKETSWKPILVSEADNVDDDDDDVEDDGGDETEEKEGEKEDGTFAWHGGLFPDPLDVAPFGSIIANATCGMRSSDMEERTEMGEKTAGKRFFSETYCKWSGTQCGVCDGAVSTKQHHISNTIDNDTVNWWQSPSLKRGERYHYVTITLDLKQEFWVSYVTVKCGISPRPAAWILEHSIDGVMFQPWQYFAGSDEECWQRYGLPAVDSPAATHHFISDTELICSTYYTKHKPFELGEIHSFVSKSRPGCRQGCARLVSAELREFSRARFVRLRLQRLHSEPVSAQTELLRRYFYSIRKMSVVAQCICNGHASHCTANYYKALGGKRLECECTGNTCGAHCEQCCPLFNQVAWREGVACEACQCHGHALSCRFDADVQAANLSLDTKGGYSGGGVCQQCQNHTEGVNCEKCSAGWYRPSGRRPDSPEPCLPCDCDVARYPGATGLCLPDDRLLSENQMRAGTCLCAVGFAGQKCETCAPGFFNYPLCQKCPCDVRGTLPFEPCNQHRCPCKRNVIGELCDACKPGFFALSAENELGCDECFCSGLSASCNEASGYKLHTIVSDLRQWNTVCSLNASLFWNATFNSDTNHSVLQDRSFYIHQVHAYYWKAPDNVLSDLSSSYGLKLTIQLNWSVLRGDTSGKATYAPDIVLIGENGLRLAYRLAKYVHVDGLEIAVRLSETAPWFLMSSNTYHDIKYWSTEADIVAQDSVTRRQIMSVLTNIRHLFIRARYHTDQYQCRLMSVQLEKGVKSERKEMSSDSDEEVGGLEECECPAGYAGMSCEKCGYGFVRSFSDLEQPEHAVCVKCDCNQHAATCHPLTGRCSECEHNTTGSRCEKCLDGFYGDAEKSWTRVDGGAAGQIVSVHLGCQPCACPHLPPATTCHTVFDSDGSDRMTYVCDECPPGHSGPTCVQCGYGYYGRTLEVEQVVSNCSRCPSECGEGGCDSRSGACVQCLDTNSEGDRCERCKTGHYRPSPDAPCTRCGCSDIGTVGSDAQTVRCDEQSGACVCKTNFVGKNCDRCREGFGNVTAGCVRCACDAIGSLTDVCDARNGLCHCAAHVVGDNCDRCDIGYFWSVQPALSSTPCQKCECDAEGSLNSYCDPIFGTCLCKRNVIGVKCDRCQKGYWNLSSGEGCVPCDCDPVGSVNGHCDMVSGQCVCRFAVTGARCDLCQPNFYHLSRLGCFPCECGSREGQVCDAGSGRCVCPQLTTGAGCRKCLPTAWNYTLHHGCMDCGCDVRGSLSAVCDERSGMCRCRDGFGGAKCDECAAGFYGFPRCRPCRCNPHGIQLDSCPPHFRPHNLTSTTTTSCRCHPVTGQCYCKKYVVGLMCSECLEGTFGLDWRNAEGCTSCFCFGRSTSCQPATSLLRPAHITMLPTSRTLTLIRTNQSTYSSNNPHIPVNTKQICYINLAFPASSSKSNVAGAGSDDGGGGGEEGLLNSTNNLSMIPGTEGDVQMLLANAFLDVPIYWQLPPSFLGDKVLSYGGAMRFEVSTEGGSTPLPTSVLSSYPLVQIQGNGNFVLEYFPLYQHAHQSHHQVRLHESLWRLKNNPADRVSRQVMMLTLQNLQHILIRATDSIDFTTATLSNVEMETGIELPRKLNEEEEWSRVRVEFPERSRWVELCDCPALYTSSSCQDPALGYYRSSSFSIITNQYNRTSSITAVSIYSPSTPSTPILSTILIQVQGGDALPCRCNGRSNTCHPETGHCLNCGQNTSGAECEKCAEGFYEDIWSSDELRCLPCPCPTVHNNHALSCHQTSTVHPQFVCQCNVGYTGKFCERCSYGWHSVDGGRCARCECHSDGSVSDECDELTGQCNCIPYVTGTTCNKCRSPNHILAVDRTCQPCRDVCVMRLLEQVEELTNTMTTWNEDTSWGMFFNSSVTQMTEWRRQILERFHSKLTEIESIYLNEYFRTNDILSHTTSAVIPHLQTQLNTAIRNVRKVWLQCITMMSDLSSSSSSLRNRLNFTSTRLKQLQHFVTETVENVKKYGSNDSSAAWSVSEENSGSLSTAISEARYLLAEIGNSNPSVLSENIRRLAQQVMRYCSDLVMNGLSERDRWTVEENGNGQVTGVEVASRRARKLLQRIDHIQLVLLPNITSLLYQIRRISDANRKTLSKITESLKDNEVSSTIFSKLNAIMQQLKNLKSGVDDAVVLYQQHFQALKKLVEQLDRSRSLCEERESILYNLNSIYREQFVISAVEHAARLQEAVLTIVKSLVRTTQNADLALKASQAYRNIVQYLSDAKHSMSEAERTLDALPSSDENAGIRMKDMLKKIVRLKELSVEGEHELNRLAVELENKIIFRNDVTKELNVMKEMVDRVIAQLLQRQHGTDGDDSWTWWSLSQENRVKWTKLEWEVTKLVDGMYDQVFTLQDNVSEQLARRHHTLTHPDHHRPLESVLLAVKEAEVKVSSVSEELKKSPRSTAAVVDEAAATAHQFAARLSVLVSKVAHTRHLAQKIDLSLSSGDASGDGDVQMRQGCSRWYDIKGNADRWLSNSLELSFAISTEHRHSSIFYWPAVPSIHENEQIPHFVSLEMVNRKIKFSWNIGAGVVEIIHPVHIETASNLHKDQHWYRIHARRVCNEGWLSVKPMSLAAGSILSDGQPQRNSSTTGWCSLVGAERVAVGVSSAAAEFQSSLHLYGTLHNLLLNHQPIGLWNFHTQQGHCLPNIPGPTTSDDNSFKFGGIGESSYALLNTHLSSSSSVYNKYLFSVSLSFKTFDRNALIFYAFPAASSNNQSGAFSLQSSPVSYISIGLIGGRVHFEVGYGGDGNSDRSSISGSTVSKMHIRTVNRFSSGNWTTLEASRYYDRKNKLEKGILKVGAERREGTPNVAITHSNIPDLSSPQYILAGLPPGYLYHQHAPPPSFIGCMSHIQIAQQPYNPLAGQFRNVQSDCNKHMVTTVGFEGDGYLELESYSLSSNEHEFAFLFCTFQKSAILLFSTTEGLSNNNGDSAKTGDSYAVMLTNGGALELVVRVGSEAELWLSTRSGSGRDYGDGVYHSVLVMKIGTRWQLRVDDQLEASGELNAVSVRAAGKAGGLFLGGLPTADLTTPTMAAAIGLIGTVKQLIFDNRLVQLSDAVELEGATLGREFRPDETRFRALLNDRLGFGLKKRLAEEMVEEQKEKEQKSRNGCAPLWPSNNVVTNSIQLGADSSEPFALALNSFNQSSQTIVAFSLRTFDLRGLLFVLPIMSAEEIGEDKKEWRRHYVKVSLEGGRLVVEVHAGKKKMRLESEGKSSLANGFWHRVVIRNVEKRLYLSIDGKENGVGRRIWRKIKVRSNRIYLEGWVGAAEDGAAESGVRGCLRHLSVNGADVQLPSTAVVGGRRGRPCLFEAVEPAAYLPGNGFALFRSAFELRKEEEFVFEIEFRTAKRNAILMSLSEPNDSPALSLELNDGKVVLRGDLGDLRPFAVSSKSEQLLCDGRWHTVKVRWLKGAECVELSVGAELRSYWLTDNGHVLPPPSIHRAYALLVAPLYVAGLPEIESPQKKWQTVGSLQTMENFSGCIRRIRISNSSSADSSNNWNFEKLHNVILDSCPISTAVSN